MASPGSSQSEVVQQTCGSEEAVMMDERRRKRKQSNRESARRSRARKHHQLQELQSQVEKLTTERNRQAAALRDATRGFAALQAENSVLRTGAFELTTRLQSLTEILSCMMSSSHHPEVINSDCTWGMMTSWPPAPQMSSNQPMIMASPDLYNSWY